MKQNHISQDYTQWNLPKGANARLGKGSITGNIAYSPDGTRLVVPSSIGIWIYDAHNLEEINLINEYKGFNCAAIGFTLSGSMLTSKFVTSLHDFYYGKLQIWDEDTRHSKDIPISMEDMGRITSLVFSPDGHTLATGNKDGTVYLWNVDTGELLITFKEQIWELVFNPNGSALAVNLGRLSFEHPDTESIGLWNVHTGNYVSIFYTNMISSNLVFSPDGRMLVCAGADRYDNRSIRLWDIAAGSSIYPSGWLSGHTGSIRYLAFSPDGQTLASGSQDSTVLLWNVDTVSASGPIAPSVSIPNTITDIRRTIDEKKNYYEYLKSDEWKKLRKSVLRRDNELCICGAKATEVHHKTYARVGNEPLSDLVSLCRNCHQNVHDNYKIN